MNFEFQNGLSLANLFQKVTPNKAFLEEFFGDCLLLLARLKGKEFLFRVAKTDRNFFPAITIGKAVSNDICLPLPNISKIHLLITKSENGWALCDHFSIHGTWLNKEKIRSGEKYLLQAPCSLQIGELSAEILDAESLVSKLLRRSS